MKPKLTANVYGCTECYAFGDVICVIDGFGYQDENGEITWFDGYCPINDEFHLTRITRLDNPKTSQNPTEE